MPKRKQPDAMTALFHKLQDKHGVRFFPLKTGMTRDGDRFATLIKGFDLANAKQIVKFVVAVPADSELGRAWSKHYDKPAKKRRAA